MSEQKAPTIEARDGDVMVVGYPEITIPLAQYSSVKAGGLIYTRKMVEGDDAAREYARIYAFLEHHARIDARRKFRLFQEELEKIRRGE